MRIGHASIDERNKITGGKAGDQTGKEVCIRTYYDKNWDYCLHPRTEALAIRSAQACEAMCANNHIGYDQNQRNDLIKNLEALHWDYTKLVKDTECDCSSFMTACALCGGAKIDYTGNAPHTRSMKQRFTASGYYSVSTFVSPKYNSLKRGDILLKEGNHTVMVLDDYSASGSYAVRPTLKYGSKGSDVVYLQQRLIEKGYDVGTSGADGDFGKMTLAAVREFQRDNGLTVDGIVGNMTWAALK